jgi:hypothetical protein
MSLFIMICESVRQGLERLANPLIGYREHEGATKISLDGLVPFALKQK